MKEVTINFLSISGGTQPGPGMWVWEGPTRQAVPGCKEQEHERWAAGWSSIMPKHRHTDADLRGRFL